MKLAALPIYTALVALFCFNLRAQDTDVSEFQKNLAPYVKAPERAITKMLEMANLRSGETLYDLGCAEGEIVIAAAERYRIRAVGIEISGHLAKTAEENVRKAGLQKRVKVVHGDFMRTDLSGADVVTLYLATTANATLRPNLERYLHPDARVISYDYPVPGWKPVKTSDNDGYHGTTHTIYLYEIPDSLKK